MDVFEFGTVELIFDSEDEKRKYQFLNNKNWTLKQYKLWLKMNIKLKVHPTIYIVDYENLI